MNVIASQPPLVIQCATSMLSTTMRRFSHFLLAILAVPLLWTGHASAFEQGSYHLFDLVEKESDAPLPGRLAVPKAALAKSSVEEPALSIADRGEFEINYSEPLETSGNTRFEFIPFEETETSSGTGTSFSTDSFDLNSTNNVFGN
jgi:hypothetical protein